MRMSPSISSLPEAKCRHRASEYVQRRCQDDMMFIERGRRFNSALVLHEGGTGANPINTVSVICCSQHTYSRRTWDPREQSCKAYMNLGADSALLPHISRNRSGRPVKSKTFLILMPNNKYSRAKNQNARFICCLLAT
jgi:hypothetical protein